MPERRFSTGRPGSAAALAFLLIAAGALAPALGAPPPAQPATPAGPPIDTAAAADTLQAAAARIDSADSAHAARPASAPVKPPGHVRAPYPGAPLLLHFPAWDWPYSHKGGYESPSMRQSLAWNVSATQLAHQTIGWAWEGMPSPFWRVFGAQMSLFAFASLWLYFPPGEAWLHEEWHRAVLTHRGVSSYNGVYHWGIGAGTIAVDHVRDADLAALKAGHPADYVRLQEAGIEGELEAFRMMRRNNFFLGRSSQYDRIHWWVNQANISAYLLISGTDWEEATLEKANAKEDRESERDFTGFDFRAWVYDMRRPQETYEQGPRSRPHPSGGPGFDRYFRYSDLDASDRGYLRLQAGLSLLNLVNPQLIGRDWLPGIDPWKRERFLWNFALIHQLTPFGFQLAADVLVRRGKWSWAYTVQGFGSGRLFLPGLGAELFRYPLPAGRLPVYLTCGASAWLQPEDQMFRTGSPEPGGSALLGLALPLAGGLEAWVEGDAKTAGWVAGNVDLGPAVQGRAGLQLRL